MCEVWCPEECAGSQKVKFICDSKVDIMLEKNYPSIFLFETTVGSISVLYIQIYLIAALCGIIIDIQAK